MILMHLGIAIMLGFADIVNTYTLSNLGPRKSYQAVFWFEVACAGASLLILIFFVKIKKAKSALTADEIAEMQAEETRPAGGVGVVKPDTGPPLVRLDSRRV
jgi:hypothetical protein